METEFQIQEKRKIAGKTQFKDEIKEYLKRGGTVKTLKQQKPKSSVTALGKTDIKGSKIPTRQR